MPFDSIRPLQVAQPADLAAVHVLRFGDVFVDENTGWTHLCDGSCELQARDDAGERMVCPLTGRVHGRVGEDESSCGGGGGGGGEEGCTVGAMAAVATAAADQDLPTGLGADCVWLASRVVLHAMHLYEPL